MGGQKQPGRQSPQGRAFDYHDAIIISRVDALTSCGHSETDAVHAIGRLGGVQHNSWKYSAQDRAGAVHVLPNVPVIRVVPQSPRFRSWANSIVIQCKKYIIT